MIQFRIQPLDLECFTKARLLFGEVVPQVSQLHDEELNRLGLTIYAMTYMPGQCWMHVPSSEVEKRVKTAQSLGTILGRGLVEDQSTDVVDTFVLPCLKRFRDSINASTKVLQPHVDRLIASSNRLKKLPLYFSHHDLNEMNVLVEEDGMVSGLVDWECAKALPFGMGLHRVLDTIVANNSQGEIEIPPSSKEAEAAFWDSVLSDAPAIVLGNLEDVQTALHAGSLIFAFTEKHLEDPGPHSAFLAALLTYRLPQLRGDAGPFEPEHVSQ